MPYTVDMSFRDFYTRINLSGDHRSIANSRRNSVVNYLSSLSILDSFSTGSIPRYTALSGSSDLDVIVVLHYGNHIEGKKPSQVLQLVRNALSEYRTDLRRNGQAVTLRYKTWPDVDVVPVSRVLDSDGNFSHYHVPNMRTETWLQSRPKLHSSNIRGRAGTVGEKFRQIICMIKHWNKINGGLMQSYHIEAMALQSINSASDYSWSVYQFFSDLHSLVQQTYLYYLGDSVCDYLDWRSRQKVTELLADAKSKASDAWYLTYGDRREHESAIRIWCEIFGSKFPKYG